MILKLSLGLDLHLLESVATNTVRAEGQAFLVDTGNNGHVLVTVKTKLGPMEKCVYAFVVYPDKFLHDFPFDPKPAAPDELERGRFDF